MCGIVGFNFKDRDLLKKMANTLKHRGPDQCGFFDDNKFSLGHTRLSIIDLKKGKQPIHNEDCSKWIVFNGEIFNFKELRKELESKHRFYTDTDTEVILHGYEEWGISVLQKLNGQFAFCIYDGQKVLLARDRLGILPLCYYYKQERFIFASEIKAILEAGIEKKVDTSVLSDYFSYLYIPSPKTVFKDIYKLEPGYYLIFENNKIIIKQYWDIKFETNEMPFNQTKEQIIERLKNSVKQRLIADVDIGAFLSGGIDSSTIVALASNFKEQLKTFSIGFEGVSDELDLSKKTAEMYNTDHHEFIVKPAEFSLFPKILYYADEPFADSSIIPTYIVSKIASKYVKVCLSGDGGDENFAGYSRFIKNKYERIYSKIPIFNDRLKRIREIARINDDSLRFIKGNEYFIDSEKKQLLNLELTKSFKHKYINNLIGLNNALYLEIKTTLPEDYMKKVDTAAMANSLEVRPPFLDHTFMEFTARIPDKYKLKLLDKKHILKKAVKGIIPKKVIFGKKKGFSAPIDMWIKGDLKNLIYDIIISSQKRGFLKKEYIEKIWNQHQNKKFNHQDRLWSIITFELWNRIFIDEIKINNVLK